MSIEIKIKPEEEKNKTLKILELSKSKKKLVILADKHSAVDMYIESEQSYTRKEKEH